MCGITGVFIKRPGRISAAQLDLFINELLVGIEHRGGHATGLAALPEKGLGALLVKKDVTAAEFIKTRPALPANTKIVLGHTRFATQGRPEENVNNHPVVYGTCFAVHNGHIANDDEVFAKHELARLGEVDSEAIPAVISKYGFDNIEAALEELQGGMAIAVADPVNFPDKLVLAKGPNSPLVFLDHENLLVWASEVGAIKDAWGSVFGTPPRDKRFSMLSEGEVMFVEPDKISFGDFTVNYPTYTGTYAQRLSASQGTGYTSSWDGNNGGGWREEAAGSYSYNGIVYHQCSSCKTYKSRARMDYVGEYYAVCEDCSVPSNPRLQTILNDNDVWECTFCTDYADPTDGEVIEGQFYCGDCLSAWNLDEPEVKEKEPRLLTAPTDMETRRYLHLLDCVAEETEYPADFVDHLLFRVSIETLDGDSKLAGLRDRFEEEYCFAEELMNQFEHLGGDLNEYLDRQEAKKAETCGVAA